MDATLEIITVSDLARQIELPQVVPLSDDELAKIERTMRRGLVLHQAMKWQPGELPLPLHVHPNVILAMVQEIRRAREANHEQV